MKKKILIISGAAGTGHIRAAEALRKTIESDYPDFEVRHIDVLDYSDWVLKKTITSGYNFIARHLPGFYRLLYRAMDISENSASIFDIFLDLFKINVRKFNKFVKQYHPDYIICTFFMAPPLLEKSIKSSTTIDFIMTDYDVNNVCVSPVVRYFFTPAKEFSERLETEGKTTFAFGIPLDTEVLKEKNIENIKKEWQIYPDRSTILISSGGIGLVDPTLIVKNILENFENLNLIIVTGKNSKKQISKMSNLPKKENINFQIIEYTDKFDELMRAADIVITKPGGLTITETLFLKKPLIFYSPIPGQEEANAEYLEKNNLGIYLHQPEEVTRAIRQIINKEKILDTMNIDPMMNKKIIDKVIE